MPGPGKLVILAASTLVVLVAQPVTATDPTSELARLSSATEVLEDLVQAPDDAIPEYVLDRAEAIVVVPQLLKGGFILGAEHGRGVMSVRDRSRDSWSVPSFVAMTGGSIGWQIGAQAVDLVLLVMNRDGIDDLLRSGFKLGADISVAAGPVGRSAQAGTDARLGAQILAYSRAKGLFAGATLQGSTLRADLDANQDVYGYEYAANVIFEMRPSDNLPAAVAKWRRTLDAVTPSTR